MSATECRDWIRLIRSENIGTVTFPRLLERFGSAGDALDALPELARQEGRRAYKVYPESKADDELARLDALGARLIAWCEPGDPRTRGTNGLIRDGAILTESAADVLRELGEAGTLSSGPQFTFDFNPVNAASHDTQQIPEARSQIKELLGNSPVAVDELVRNCQFSIATVSAVLLELELAGRLERHPGNRDALLLTTIKQVSDQYI